MSETILVEEDQPPASATPPRARIPWRLRFAGPFVPTYLAPMWAKRSQSMLLAVALGMLVAATLLGSVPVYSDLVSDVQLQYVLAARPPVDVDVEGIVTTGNLSDANARRIDAIALSTQRSLLAGFAPSMSTYLEGDSVAFTAISGRAVNPGLKNPYSDLASSNGRPYAFDFASAAPHMNILTGRLPRDVQPGQMPEMLVTPKLGVAIGNTVTVAQIAAPGTDTTARVVGIWFPKNQDDPFWNGHSYDTVDSHLTGPASPPVYPLVFTRGGFFSSLQTFVSGIDPFGNRLSRYTIHLHYLAYTQPTLLNAHNVSAAIVNLSNYRRRLTTDFPPVLSVYTFSVVSHLDPLLQELQRQLSLLDLPLYVVVAQIAALTLFFVMVLSGLLVESQALPVATLTSRGASPFQLVGGFALLSLLPALFAVLGGLLLANRLALWLIATFVPASHTVSAGYLARAAPVEVAAPPVIAAVALGMLAVGLAALQTLRRDLLSVRREQARGPRDPSWKRYYLDVVLAVVCLAAYLDLGQFGGLNIRSQLSLSSDTRADPLLIAAPVFLLLASALIVSRLLPLVAFLGARLASRRRGITGMLAFAGLSRMTGHVARIALLLALSIGMGIFALNFASSLDGYAADSAAYATGGDQRVLFDPSILNTGYVDLLQRQIWTLPGVEAATSVARADFKTPLSQGGSTVGGLGINPDELVRLAYWRPDYADQSLPVLMDQMRHHVVGSAAGEPDHPVWALVSTDLASQLHLRPGERFSLNAQEGAPSPMSFVVGAIVDDFPTMYNSYQAGYIVVDQADLFAAYANPHVGNLPQNGPSEYWLRTSGRPSDDAARTAAFTRLGLVHLITGIVDRRALAIENRGDPLTAGMSGLLLTGSAAVALLAVLACLAHATTTARARRIQFGVLRSLGVSIRQLRAILLGEQLVIYTFGAASGFALGLLLSSATLPFLTFSSTLVDPATLGVPPYLVTLNLPGLATCLTLLIAAFAASVDFQAHMARTMGLDRALRLGED